MPSSNLMLSPSEAQESICVASEFKLSLNKTEVSERLAALFLEYR